MEYQRSIQSANFDLVKAYFGIDAYPFSLLYNTHPINPGVASSIRALSHTFVEIDHEIFSTAILLSSADSRTKGLLSITSESTG